MGTMTLLWNICIKKVKRGILYGIFCTLASECICAYIYFRSQVASVKGCLLADEQGLCLGGKYSIS